MARQTRSRSSRDSTAVQSVLLPKSAYTVTQARAWLKRNGFRVSKKEPEGKSSEYLHFRQHDPKDFEPGTYRTIMLGDGVKATVAVPLASKVGRGTGSGIRGPHLATVHRKSYVRKGKRGKVTRVAARTYRALEGYDAKGPERKGGAKRRRARSAAGRSNPGAQDVRYVDALLAQAQPGDSLNLPLPSGDDYAFFLRTRGGWRGAVGPKRVSGAMVRQVAAEFLSQGWVFTLVPGGARRNPPKTVHTVMYRDRARDEPGDIARGSLRRNHDARTAKAMIRAAERTVGTPGQDAITYARAEGNMNALAGDSLIPSRLRGEAAETRTALYRRAVEAQYDERERLLRVPRSNPGKSRSPKAPRGWKKSVKGDSTVYLKTVTVQASQGRPRKAHYRIARGYGSGWRLDYLGMLGNVWESVTPDTYATPQQAADGFERAVPLAEAGSTMRSFHLRF